MIRRLSEHTAERAVHLHLVIGEPDDVAPIRTALALGAGRVRVLGLRRPGEDLPVELRIARYGLGVRRDADRAVERLVNEASDGARVSVASLPADEAGVRAVAERLAAASLALPLVVGWTRHGPLPPVDRLRPLVEGCPGAVALLLDDAGPPFEEVLGLRGGADDDPAVPPAGQLLRALERSRPAFRVHAGKASAARAALGDAGVRTLVILPVTDPVPGGLLDDVAALESATRGPLLVVFAPGQARRALDVLEALAEARAGRAAS